VFGVGAASQQLPNGKPSALRERPRLNVAVAGMGYWGPQLLRNLVEVENATVTTICDIDPVALGRQAQRYPYLTLTDSLDELLADTRVDAVAVATPVATHHEVVRRALEAGKHVLVEKPLAGTTAEAEELRDLAADNDLTLMPGHTFLYSPPVVAVKALLDKGEIGRVHFGTASRVNLGIHQPDASVIQDLAPHDFSMLLYWLGRPSFVRAIGRAVVMEGVVDVAFIDVGYENGCLMHIDLSWLAPTKLRRTVLVGTRKMIVYEDTSTEQVRIFDRGVEKIEPENFSEFRLAYRSGDIVIPRLEHTEPLRLELDDFVASARDGREPRSHVGLGIDVVRMMEAAERSLELDGAAVELNGWSEPPAGRDGAVSGQRA
jgi:predicted dehydrogenase